MQYQPKLEKPGKRSVWPRRPGWFAPRCILLAAGCSTTETTQADPLKGQIHPQNPTQYGSAPPPSAAQPASTKTTGGVPGIPSTQAPYNNMALASMQGDRARCWPSMPEEAPAPRASHPTLATDPPSCPCRRDSAATVPASSGSTGDVLQAQLRARGVIWQKQEAVADGIRFTCIVPNRINPETSKIYEATARDAVTAIQAILVQIDQK